VVSPNLVRALLNERLAEHDQLNRRVFLQEEGLSIASVYGHQSEFFYWPFSSTAQRDTPLQQRSSVEAWFSEHLGEILPEGFRGRFDKRARFVLKLWRRTSSLKTRCFTGRLNQSATPIKIGVRGLSVQVTELPFQATNILGGGNSDVNLYFARRALSDKSEQRRFFGDKRL
jgi:hypothetical protein